MSSTAVWINSEMQCKMQKPRESSQVTESPFISEEQPVSLFSRSLLLALLLVFHHGWHRLSFTRSLLSQPFPPSLCWGTIKTVSNAATYSTAHTLNCVNVWVHIIFLGCHSLRLFSLFSITERPGIVGPECMIYLSPCARASCQGLCAWTKRIKWFCSAKQRLRMKWIILFIECAVCLCI